VQTVRGEAQQRREPQAGVRHPAELLGPLVQEARLVAAAKPERRPPGKDDRQGHEGVAQAADLGVTEEHVQPQGARCGHEQRGQVELDKLPAVRRPPVPLGGRSGRWLLELDGQLLRDVRVRRNKDGAVRNTGNGFLLAW